MNSKHFFVFTVSSLLLIAQSKTIRIWNGGSYKEYPQNSSRLTVGWDTIKISGKVEHRYLVNQVDSITYGNLGDSFVDSRDGQVYRTVRMGHYLWMAENLRFGTEVPQSSSYTNNMNFTKSCIKSSLGGCAKGSYYNYIQALHLPDSCLSKDCSTLLQPMHQGACPTGWHIPNYENILDLENSTGTQYDSSALSLRGVAPGYPNWPLYGNIMRSGFDALRLGELRGDTAGLTKKAIFWGIIPPEYYAPLNAFTYSVDSSKLQLITKDKDLGSFGAYKANSYSVRCVQDKYYRWENEPADSVKPVFGTFTDNRDGENYKTMTYGKQTWMAENLRHGTFAKIGSEIVDDDKVQKVCLGNVSTGCKTVFYAWSEAMALPKSCMTQKCAQLVQNQHQGACPNGWRVPSNADWLELERTASGMSTQDTAIPLTTVASRLKAMNGINWVVNPIDVNITGMSISPEGLYLSPTTSSAVSNDWDAGFFTATEVDSQKVVTRIFEWNKEGFYRTSYYFGDTKTHRLSLRCIKN